MALVPVKITGPDRDKCAACALCDHAATAPTARGAIVELARTCPGEAVHSYYPDRLPAGVRLEYVHRGRRLPCHLVGRELVGGGGAISKASPVFAVCESAATAAGRAVGKLVAQLGPKRRKEREAVPAGPGRKARSYRPAYTIPGWKVTVEVEAAAPAGSA